MTFPSDYDEDGGYKNMNGHGHLDNRADIIGSDRMRYRSQAERKVGEELSKIPGLTYGANTVFRSRHENGKVKKIEVDFHVCYKGQQLFVEVDGPHHVEGVTEAEARLMPFRDCIIEVRRYPVGDEEN